MRQLVDNTPTRTPAAPDRQHPSPRPARLWPLLEAMGYVSAFFDPTGVLAARRFRRAEEAASRGRR